jgi:hypothetical protein
MMPEEFHKGVYLFTQFACFVFAGRDSVSLSPNSRYAHSGSPLFPLTSPVGAQALAIPLDTVIAGYWIREP